MPRGQNTAGEEIRSARVIYHLTRILFGMPQDYYHYKVLKDAPFEKNPTDGTRFSYDADTTSNGCRDFKVSYAAVVRLMFELLRAEDSHIGPAWRAARLLFHAAMLALIDI